jgi:bis(5'-nucleosidyl)-tetraphosphatase
MPIEKSAGAIVFRKEEGEIYYLLLHYPGFRGDRTHWDFPKGQIEKGESIADTAKREVGEETGIRKLRILPEFKETIKYFFKFKGENIMKFVTFFLAESEEKEVKLSHEHIGFKWLPYNEAIKQLTYSNAKAILKKADSFLSEKSI